MRGEQSATGRDVYLKALRELELFNAHYDCPGGVHQWPLTDLEAEVQILVICLQFTRLLSGRVSNPGVTFKPMFLTIILCHLLRYREKTHRPVREQSVVKMGCTDGQSP